jgi:hypothetical protein
MEALYPWIVFVHVLGAFGFVLGHGVSVGVALRLRQERELERIRALLDLSRGYISVMYVALYVLLGGGILAGFVAGLWGRLWIWTALALLVALTVFMYVRAAPYFGQMRRAAGLPYEGLPKGAAPDPPDRAALLGLVASPRPMELAVVGFVGLIAILWLMFFKPF